ncbi:MAG: tRNA adenosine(34) deaminase TadA [Moraxella sp.]|nr:tRNA adenosine(34) deaminase TadA [Moraxella sp.]MDO4449353.1 tRNA adenosine(34) deaminase TadA [Moraxella sp.]
MIGKNNFLKSTSQILLKSDDDFDNDDKHFMQIALDLAQQGAKLGEVPVGAVVVLDNQIIGQGFNCPISQKDSTAHAEMVAIRQACENLDNYRLMGATLYVTLEPCTMCLGAIIHSRISRVIFGASEPKAGVIISQENFAEKRYFNHYITIEGGLFAERSGRLLQEFFRHRRTLKRQAKSSLPS